MKSNKLKLIEMRCNRVTITLSMKRLFEFTYAEYQTNMYPLEVVEAYANDDAIVGF